MIIVVVGNEGAGKTTLAKRLRKDQFQVKECEGIDIQSRSGEEIFLILDVPIEIARQRLQAAGKNLNIHPYTIEALTKYREHYLEASRLLPHCHIIDASSERADIYAIAMNSISSLVAQRHRKSSLSLDV